MKTIEWLNRNRIKFESGYKIFDRQTNIISTGNISANTEYGSFVRSYEETECNGFENPKGHLQNFDLDIFQKIGVSNDILYQVRKILKTKGGILYVFKHLKNEKRIIDGVVLTTKDNKLIQKWYCRNTLKSMDAVDEAIKYITED
jgi:hypothetical protein